MSLTKLLSALLLAFIQLTVASQSIAPQFSVQQLQGDYDILVRALKEAHPGLYRYTTKEKFDNIFKTARRQINHPMTVEAFYKLVAPVIASIKCGHTKWYPEGKPDDRYPFRQDSLFPVKLYFTDGKAFVLYSYDSSINVPAGSEVLTINGKAVTDIVRQLKINIPADADVQSSLYEELNQSFSGYYATFMENASKYTITYTKDGKTTYANLPGVNLQAIAAKEANNKPLPQLPLRLTYPGDSIAILSIDNFYVDENVQKFYPFIDSVFLELKHKKIPDLIIDVRNNEGGEEDWGGYLYSYLTEKKFTYYKKLTVTKKGHYSFERYAAMPPELEFLRKFLTVKNGEILFTKQQYLYEQQPQENRFTGKTYILINGRSFSVTTEFTSMVHNNKRATFIGEETGGAYYGNNSGVFAILTLPATRLTAGIPLVGFYSNVYGYPYKNRGILPNFTVKNSVDDVLLKRDAVTGFTLKLIERSRK